jgi:radical SAM family uncharacterized protein
MKQRELTILKQQVENEFLPFVRRPARYIGGEINQVKKDLARCGLRIALCFPDLYEIGMSYTGLGIIYNILNNIEGVAAERCFAPWIDAEEILRKKNIPLFSLESFASLKSFDCLGFSLTTELCYTNVLNMLDLAGIKLRSYDRGEDEPLIIGGGQMANCCEPVADFFDMFVIGEGEEAVAELAKLLIEEKNLSKEQLLEKIALKFDWAYIPRFYRFETENGVIKKFGSNLANLPMRFNNAVVEDFENAPVPEKPIVPFAQTVHERISIEIMRGCPGRCRFCLASFCRRPVRYRSPEKILDIAKKCFASTGFDTIGLLSLSSGDYPELEKLTQLLDNFFREKKVGLSLPSLRVDQQLKLLPALVTSVRKGGITIAVEAASERLRQIINKPLKDEDLFAAVGAAWQGGWGQIKLYFMAGLPGETQEDIRRIVELSYQLAQLRKDFAGRAGVINAAVSWFVPKPHTPFGWLEQKDRSYFENAKQLILSEKRKLNAKTIQFKFHNIERSILESAVARGGRNLSNVIEFAWKSGAKFDLWDECFNFDIWKTAFEKFGLNLEKEAAKSFAIDQILPWEHLGGPEKKYLLTHLEEALELERRKQ